MNSTLIVRGFELLCIGLWLVGLVMVRRMRSPVAAGIYLGSSTLMVFDWVFNMNWFFRVVYAEAFLPLWTIQGVKQPIALAANYAFFFGVPVLLLVRYRAQLDRLFGSWGYVAVFLLGALLDLSFEIPMVKLGIWTYYQAPAFLLGGVPWSNFWYSGLLLAASYGAARLAVRWAEPKEDRESRWKGFAMGTAAIWSAFYLCLSLQMVWYGVTQPWVAGPRPF
jgi:hypothetical protein